MNRTISPNERVRLAAPATASSAGGDTPLGSVPERVSPAPGPAETSGDTPLGSVPVHEREPASLGAALAAALLLLFAAAPSVLAKERVLNQELPAGDHGAIVLAGDIGSVVVEVGGEDTVQISVEVRPEKMSDQGVLGGLKKWFLASAYDDLDDLMQAIRLDVDSSKPARVRVGLAPSLRARDSRVREDWKITVPRRFAVRIEMSRADIDVRDVAGGVEISLGNGAVDVDVPEGDLGIDVTVGKARVRSGSESVGELDLRARVGDTNLWMNGMRVKYTDPPGPGSHVSLSGEGRDSIEISVEVGDATLRVNE